MRLKPSWIVAKRDDISSIWSNGKATLTQKTPGNHEEMYAMPKKKWKTSTNNILTNRNPLLLIEESLSLQTVQSLTLSDQCSNSQRHHGDHDLKGGVMLQFQHFKRPDKRAPFPISPYPSYPSLQSLYLTYLFLHCPIIPTLSNITLSLHFISDHSASDNLSRGHSIQIVYPSSVPTLPSLPSIPL